MSETEHPRIMRAMEDHWSKSELDPLLDALHLATRARNREMARAILIRPVREYQLPDVIEDLVWTCRDQLDPGVPENPAPLLVQNA